MEDNKNGKDNFQLNLREEIAGGIYSNFVVISHSSSEFVTDFVQILPGMSKAEVQSRIILAPEHAKRLLLALQDNIKKYEKTFGEIQLQDNGNGTNFGPVIGEA